MTRHNLARPRVFGTLLESFDRDEQEQHDPGPVWQTGIAVFLVLVIGPVVLWTMPLWLWAYYMLVVASIFAFWWLDRGFVVRIGYGVNLLGTISLLTYMDHVRYPSTDVWEPMRFKWFVVLAAVSFVVASVRRMRRMRRKRTRLPTPGGDAD